MCVDVKTHSHNILVCVFTIFCLFVCFHTIVASNAPVLQCYLSFISYIKTNQLIQDRANMTYITSLLYIFCGFLPPCGTVKCLSYLKVFKMFNCLQNFLSRIFFSNFFKIKNFFFLICFSRYVLILSSYATFNV